MYRTDLLLFKCLPCILGRFLPCFNSVASMPISYSLPQIPNGSLSRLVSSSFLYWRIRLVARLLGSPWHVKFYWSCSCYVKYLVWSRGEEELVLEPACHCMQCTGRARLKCGESNISSKEGWSFVLEYPVAWWGNVWDVESSVDIPMTVRADLGSGLLSPNPCSLPDCWVTVEDTVFLCLFTVWLHCLTSGKSSELEVLDTVGWLFLQRHVI